MILNDGRNRVRPDEIHRNVLCGVVWHNSDIGSNNFKSCFINAIIKTVSDNKFGGKNFNSFDIKRLRCAVRGASCKLTVPGNLKFYIVNGGGTIRFILNRERDCYYIARLHKNMSVKSLYRQELRGQII